VSFTVDRLTAEHLVDPLGLDLARPRLGWRIVDAQAGSRQAAYCLRANGWNGGRSRSGDTTDIAYPGPTGQRVEWQVEVWLDDGRSASSVPAVFEQGLATWSGDWICRPVPADAHDGNRPAALLRTGFRLASAVARARLHVTAGGLYEPWLNGARVGTDCLAPGWTDYRSRIRARTHDVTDLLQPGDNSLGVVVMDGWYAGYVGWDHLREHYGRTPVAKVELVVDLVRGEQIRVVSGPHWKGCHGPVRSGDLLGGEIYDARYEQPGWTQAGFDDSQWEHAWPDPGPAGAIVGTSCEPVRVMGEVAPVAISSGRPGSRIFDLGEQIVGWPRLTVTADPGTTVRLRCAEALDAAGELWTANLRGAACTDTYIAGASGGQAWEPRSTYRGFRYVEVTGPSDAEVTGVVAHSDIRPTGDFSCSSPDLTALWEAVRRTVRANLVSLPTDCPQRDERLGWLADAEVTLETASYFFDIGPLFAGWLADLRSGQSPAGAFPDVAPRLAHTGDGAPGWGDAGVAVPWGLWRWYGDRQVLADNIEAMARWPQWIASANPDGVWRHGRGRDYGDWLSPVETPKQLLATAWWARSCELVAASAGVLGRDDLRARAQNLLATVRAGYAREWVDLDCSPQQTGLLLGLAFGLLPDVDAARRRLVADVEEHGMTTGFQGVRHLLPQLTAAGRTDLAYAVALSEGSPGWLGMLRQGATSIWERWDAQTADPFLNSRCHAALGTIATWLHATVGGLTRHPGLVGWRRALVEPQPGGGVDWAQTTYDSRLGVYAVEWELADQVLEVYVEVPVGGEALVRVAGELAAPVAGLRTYLGRTTGLLPAGQWTVRIKQETQEQRRTLST